MSQSTDLQVFDFQGWNVRVVMIDGEPWWVAADVCKVLGIQDARQAAERLDEGDRCQIPLGRNGQVAPVQAWIINESGLYDLIMRSDKEAARPFRRWVTSDLLPTVRKTGSYGQTSLAAMSPREIAMLIIAEADRAEKAEGRVLELETRTAELEPAADGYRALMDTTDLMSMNTAAKIMGTGPNKLFAYLRQHGVLISFGERRNLPYQRHIEAARFDVKLGVRVDSKGEKFSTWTTLVTPRGLEFIRDLFTKKGRP